MRASCGGTIEQGDLDLALNHCGGPRTEGFVANADGFATANVDQEEFDSVLNNWGGEVLPDFRGVLVLEPAFAKLLAGLFLLPRRRAA